ncbi:MAG: sigma-54 dependent transcriptional regulator [Tagaea sp.]|nr:sigma-54 dependent transcriptional regulator [Tagaea sp.]
MANGLRILLIEDDVTLGPALMQRLRLEGFDPVLATDGATALAVARREPPDAVLSDIRLPDMDGEAIWRRMLDGQGPLPTWFMTAHGDVGQAVRLVKAGARDYLTKPVDVDAIVAALDALRPPAAADGSGGFGVSPAARAFEAELAKAAKSDLPVLLAGETGSGKEVAAKLAHRRSSRAGAPFVAINCAAIPAELAESVLFGHEKGAFTGALARRAGVAEEAGPGTLFLDEIAELAPPLQAKLLRLVEAKEYRPVGARGDTPFRARLICATHADLAQRVRDGRFREDLFYRLNVIALTVPPLRARGEDIEHLARTFAADAGLRAGRPRADLSPESLEALRAHEWPGNVRELRNRVERAVAMAEGAALGVEDLFPESRLDFRSARAGGETGEGGLDAAAQAAIRERVADALVRAGGNRTEAAKLLGVSRTTIWKYSK